MNETEPEDAAERETVECDDLCGAFAEPITIEEFRAALEHWMSHSFLGGCSHAC